MSLARRVSYNTAAQVAGRLLSAAASVGVLRMSTRYLGVNTYGDYVTASALVLLLTTLADWGLVTIAAREIARDSTRGPEIVGVNLAMRGVLSLMLVPVTILIGYLAYRTNHDVRFAVAVLSPMLVFVTIQSTAGAVFVARERADLMAAFDVFTGLLLLAGVWIVVRANWGFGAFLWSSVVVAAIGAAVSLALSRRYVRPKAIFDLAVWKRSLLIALPLGIIQVINVVYFKVDSIILSVIRHPQDVAHYGVAYKVIELVMALPSFFMTALMPALVVAARPRMRELVQQAWDVLITAAVAVTVIGFLFARTVVVFVSSRAFLPAVAPFRLLLVGAGASFVSAVYGNALVAIDEQRRLVPLTITVTTANVALNLALVPHFGAEGAAAAMAATEILAMVYVSRLFSRLAESSVRVTQLPRALLGGVVMVAAWALLRHANLLDSEGLGVGAAASLGMLVLYVATVAAVGGRPPALRRRAVRGEG